MNTLSLTDNELECVRHFLNEAQGCGYPSANEPFYPTINKIMGKIYEIVYPPQPDPWSIFENDYEDWSMTIAPTFSGQILHAPFTAFQIELMADALGIYKQAGYDSKDVEYLEDQLVLYHSMLLEKHRRDSVTDGWKSSMEDEPLKPEEWRAEFQTNYSDLKLIRECVDSFYQRWPGYPARPLHEQDQLRRIRDQLDQACLDYIFRFKWTLQTGNIILAKSRNANSNLKHCETHVDDDKPYSAP